MSKQSEQQNRLFDDIKHTDSYGNEYWLARELQGVLQYAKWENFHRVVKTAQIACKISRQTVSDHFVEIKKMVEMPTKPRKNQPDFGFPEVGKTKMKPISDYRLTRYACYLIVMNGDPRKEVIALGQTYFAVKTRQQELAELYELLSEDERRLFIRGDIRQKNMLLAEASHKAGIITRQEYAKFQDAGYRGLYGGMTAKDIAEQKKLSDGDEILDWMGGTELAANLFRITQTEEKMRREGTDTPEKANATHYAVGKAVRDTIASLGGTMPENLPVPDKSIPQIESEQHKQIKRKKD